MKSLAKQQLKSLYKSIGILRSIQRLVQWDADVMMPIGSSSLRAQHLEFLSCEIYQKLSNSRIEDLICKAENENLGKWDQANLRLIKKEYQQNKLLDKNFVAAYTKACFTCEVNWREARKNNNFQLFAKYFKEVLSLTKEKAQRKAEASDFSLYDSLLDEYDESRKSAEIDLIFNELEQFLPGFIEKVKDKQKSIVINDFDREFDIEKQKELGLFCAKAFRLDFNKARMDVSTHPFSTSFSSKDVRITSRYDKNDFLSGLFGVIHETGHALYEQNIPTEFEFQLVNNACGMTIHESQSLFYEKQIGKSKEFLKWIEPSIKKYFGEVDIDNLYNIITRVGNSRIRVDADEVTYPAHIILRYKLEKAMLNGELDVGDLPKAWDELSMKLLGFKPDSLAQGCLQDIHWAWGAIGYFPTYTLGAILASQIAKKMQNEINLAKAVLSGDFYSILEWLNNKIHCKASLESSNELIINTLGNPLDCSVYRGYLSKKYLL